MALKFLLPEGEADEQARLRLLERFGKTRKLFVYTNSSIRKLILETTGAWFGMTYLQVRAATFHELLHVGTSENYGPTVNGHDAELFYAEMDVFGQWKRDLRPLQYQPELL